MKLLSKTNKETLFDPLSTEHRIAGPLWELSLLRAQSSSIKYLWDNR